MDVGSNKTQKIRF